MSAVMNANVANDVGALNGLRQVARKDKTEALKAVAKQFEAIVMQQLLKSARETRWDDGFGDDAPGTGSMDSYREWRDDQFAQTLSAKGSLGLADMLVKQLSPKLVSHAGAPASANEIGQPKQAVPMPRTYSGVAQTGGWWRVPVAADVSAPPKAEAEVALPSTDEVILLHNLLQGKINTTIDRQKG